MEPLMRAIWESCNRDELDPECGYAPGRGITLKPPRLVWTSGPGAGSVVSFATYAQGATRIAGGTYHYVGCDEPMPEELWGEVRARVRSVKGDIGITVTPTPEHPPQAWLAERCEDGGEFSLTQAELTEANCTPEGGRPWMDQAEIDALIQSWLPIEREMRCGRSWEPLAADRALTGFSDLNISTEAPPEGAQIVVGVDHGSGAGRQRAVVGAAAIYPSHVRVWLLGEAASDGRTTPADDARGIIRAVSEACPGAGIANVDHWVGDRRHAGDRWGGEKSNTYLKRGFAEVLNCEVRELPAPLRKMLPPSKYRGSPYAAARLVNAMFLAGHLTVHPRCVETIRCIRTWRGRKTELEKDAVDAMFYAVVEVADPTLAARRARR